MSFDAKDVLLNPLDPQEDLKVQPPTAETEIAHPATAPQDEDSATTKAEKIERHPYENGLRSDEPPTKKVKMETPTEATPPTTNDRRKGIAPIKAEYCCQFAVLGRSLM